MHYFEDYLELLEPLRETMREKFTLIRENDLKLQVEFAQLEEDSSGFLNNYRLYQKQSPLSPTKTKINTQRLATPTVNDQSLELTSEQLAAQQEKQIEYDKLVERHEQLLKLTTKKIDLANESYDFVDRYYKKLENDLDKFKMELEADYSGLTETLEKRFASEGYNENDDRTYENSTINPSLFNIEPFFDPFNDLAMSNSLTDEFTNQSTLSYLASQSRYLSNSLNPCNPLLLLNRKQHQRLHSIPSRGRKRLQNTLSTNNPIKRKRNAIHNSFLNDSHYFHHDNIDELSSNTLSTNHYFNLNNPISSSNLFDNDINEDYNDQLVGTIDERRYCFCNEMSYGDMIACDNPTCCREWFHYSCVGIITPPKGKWFCDECTQISTVKRA